jgi:hypothetical protein
MTKKKSNVIQIKSRFSGDVLYEAEGETLRDVVVKAVAERAYLRGARLSRADLRGADLREADLCEADLSEADLREADLCEADLRGADLRGADLREADLRGADLRGAHLSGAHLSGAHLSGADLPSPTAVLLATWPDLSPQLVADLMVYDASCHPDPTAFDRWAAGGRCPYNGVRVQRAANFNERKELWGKGEACRPYDLMRRVLEECCPDWPAEQVAEFEKRFKMASPPQSDS